MYLPTFSRMRRKQFESDVKASKEGLKIIVLYSVFFLSESVTAGRCGAEFLRGFSPHVDVDFKT